MIRAALILAVISSQAAACPQLASCPTPSAVSEMRAEAQHYCDSLIKPRFALLASQTGRDYSGLEADQYSRCLPQYFKRVGHPELNGGVK